MPFKDISKFEMHTCFMIVNNVDGAGTRMDPKNIHTSVDIAVMEWACLLNFKSLSLSNVDC